MVTLGKDLKMPKTWEKPFYSNIRMKELLYEVRCLKSNEDMILALAGQFVCDFVDQLVRASTGIAEVMGSNPVESPEFFQVHETIA